MTVWVELQDGTKHTYKNVNRIVERSGKVEIRGGVGWGDGILVIHDKAQIKSLGDARMMTISRIQIKS